MTKKQYLHIINTITSIPMLPYVKNGGGCFDVILQCPIDAFIIII